MRRIIERIVTVVTTTTWKISWEAEADPPQPGTVADPVSLQSSEQQILQSTPPRPRTAEAKEVDVSVTKDINETNGR